MIQFIHGSILTISIILNHLSTGKFNNNDHPAKNNNDHPYKSNNVHPDKNTNHPYKTIINPYENNTFLNIPYPAREARRGFF